MFRNIIKNLYRRKNYCYLLIAFLAASLVVCWNIAPLASETLLANAAEQRPTADLIDAEEFSGMVDKLEQKWESDYEGHFRRNFSNTPRSAKKIAEHLREIRKEAQVNPAVIWAAPQKDFLQLILITPDDQYIAKKIRGASRARLQQRIRELEIGIQDRRSLRYFPPARLIYNWIFRPLEPYLTAENIDTLLLCTGPNLRSLPFSALHDGEQFMVEKYNLARIPAFGLTDTNYDGVSNQQVLAMGTSEFEDLPALPGVDVELDTIVPQLWSGQKITNQDFTVDNLRQAHRQGKYDIIHIASHSEFNEGTPDNSYIQFSDRKLTLDELDKLKLDSPQVDLLVLSSCETALGNEDAEFGFAGLAMQAGVKSALASLWPVSDAGTVALMSEFYQQLKLTPIKSEALRKAQLKMLNQTIYFEAQDLRGSNLAIRLPKESVTEEQQNFNHPFYWASFTLIGNPW